MQAGHTSAALLELSQTEQHTPCPTIATVYALVAAKLLELGMQLAHTRQKQLASYDYEHMLLYCRIWEAGVVTVR